MNGGSNRSRAPGSSGTGGRCSASAARRPTSPRAAGRRRRLEARDQRRQLGVRELAQDLRIRVVEIRAERQDPARDRQHHQRVRDRLARERVERALGRRGDRRRRALHARAGAPGHSRRPRSSLGDVRRRPAPRGSPAAGGSARAGRSRGWPEQQLLRASGVAGVARERGAQQRARPAGRPRAARRGTPSRSPASQVARELVADLLEDLAVAARDGVGGQLDRVERRVQAAPSAARAASRGRTARAAAASARTTQRVQQRAIAPSRSCTKSIASSPRIVAPGLARGPGRERAPVRALAGSPRDLGREQRVRVGDLEVAQDRVADRRDPPDLVSGSGPVRWSRSPRRASRRPARRSRGRRRPASRP